LRTAVRNRRFATALAKPALDGDAKARRFYELVGAQTRESKVSEPPGGGITVWRYVWFSLKPLLAIAAN
jgi:hypothetical protein